MKGEDYEDTDGDGVLIPADDADADGDGVPDVVAELLEDEQSATRRVHDSGGEDVIPGVRRVTGACSDGSSDQTFLGGWSNT